jgi:hypothetical protein
MKFTATIDELQALDQQQATVFLSEIAYDLLTLDQAGHQCSSDPGAATKLQMEMNRLRTIQEAIAMASEGAGQLPGVLTFQAA